MHDGPVEYPGDRDALGEAANHLGAAGRGNEEHTLGAEALDLGGEAANAARTEHHSGRQRQVGEVHGEVLADVGRMRTGYPFCAAPSVP